MITVSGKALSRAWLAVSTAASDDQDRWGLWRAVIVEEHHHGVRLIATDSYWMAWCWVPAYTVADDHVPPGLYSPPIQRAIVVDSEHRIRDLMKHVARTTRPKEALDEPVEIDLNAVLDDDGPPTLLPELAKAGARFELPSRERVLGEIFEGVPLSWTDMHTRFELCDRGSDRETISGWMLEKVGRVATIVGAPAVSFDYLTEHRQLWAVTGPSTSMRHLPAGLLMTTRDTVPDGIHSTDDPFADDDGHQADPVEEDDDGVLRDERGAPSSVGEGGPPVPSSSTTLADAAADAVAWPASTPPSRTSPAAAARAVPSD